MSINIINGYTEDTIIPVYTYTLRTGITYYAVESRKTVLSTKEALYTDIIIGLFPATSEHAFTASAPICSVGDFVNEVEHFLNTAQK